MSRSTGGANFTFETYKWEDDNLVLKERETQEIINEKKFRYVLEKRDSNGELVITEDIFIQEQVMI